MGVPTGPFNERDVSDKPPWIQSLPRLSERVNASIDKRHENRVESPQALDDLVEGVVNKLNNAGVMRNTYIFFTSDNGWEEGEHRIQREKTQPYEESSRVPLLVGGPGVQAGSTTSRLALNTDYFPTFTHLAGIQTPSYVDGRSLRPVLKGSATASRSATLMERRSVRDPDKSFYGIRTSAGWKYIEYNGGGRELYHLRADPYELRNNYRVGALPTGLAGRIDALKSCSGASCRSAENA